MTDEELIAQLRDLSAGPSSYLQDMGNTAADRIKALLQAVRHANDHADVAIADMQSAEDRIEALVKDKERLGREVNMARYGQPDFAWSIHKQAMADLQARAERLEAALREIAKPYPADQDRLIHSQQQIASIARTALKGDNHE